MDILRLVLVFSLCNQAFPANIHICLRTLMRERAERVRFTLRPPKPEVVAHLYEIFLPISQDAVIAKLTAKAIATAKANPEITLGEFADNFNIESEYRENANLLLHTDDILKAEPIREILSKRPLTYASYLDALSIYTGTAIHNGRFLFPLMMLHTFALPNDRIMPPGIMNQYFGGIHYPIQVLTGQTRIRAHQLDLSRELFSDHDYFHAQVFFQRILASLGGENIKISQINWDAVVKWSIEWHEFVLGWQKYASAFGIESIPKLRDILFFALVHEENFSISKILKNRGFDERYFVQKFNRDIKEGDDIRSMLGTYADQVTEEVLGPEVGILQNYIKAHAPEFPNFIHP